MNHLNLLPKPILILTIAIVVLIAAGSVMYINGQFSKSSSVVENNPAGSSGSEENAFCTMDVKICPDGSEVGRIPPSCEFAPCPTDEASDSASRQEVTVTGEVICLPHKDTSGPVTLECAYGIRTDDGKNYALKDPQLKYIPSLTSGKSVTVTGKLSEDAESKYDIAGVIEITSLSSD